MPITPSGIHPWACRLLNASLGFLHPCSLTTTEARKHVAERKRHPPSSPASGSGSQPRIFHVESKKLAPKYVGPFKVDRRINPVTYRLHLPPSMRIHPTFHVSRLWPFLCGTWPPALRLVAGSPAYTIHHLLDSHHVQGGIQYLVDWEGYGPDEQSWVPAHHILDLRLVRDFQRAWAAGLLGLSLGGFQRR
ncbi:hypothetical protein AOLI_G00035450 [Acnodon oligacanthus]